MSGKKTNKKKVCKVCGRKMKKQFNGLYHCKCGSSCLKGRYFERTSDMVFKLDRNYNAMVETREMKI